jgi:hypothetical protein
MTRDDRNDLEKAMDIFLKILGGDDPAGMMREAEVHKGFTVVPVGSVPWLPASDWGPRDVVSTDGVEVRLVAIGAKRPRNGAFTLLLSGILSAGLRPVIICPMPVMRGIMRRWGWLYREIDGEFDEREEQWRPPRGWRPRGEAFASAGTGTPAEATAAAGGPSRQERGAI